MKKRRTRESSTPGRADLRGGTCRRGVSSPLAIVASLLAASIIFFSALSRIAEHREKKKTNKNKFKGNWTLHLTSKQLLRVKEDWKDSVPGSSAVTWHQHTHTLAGLQVFAVCWKVDRLQANIYTPSAQPAVISKHTWTYPSCLPLSVSRCCRQVK